jgi:hypothetical protein
VLLIVFVRMFFVYFFALLVFVFVVIDGSSSDTLRKLSDDSSRKHLSGELNFYIKSENTRKSKSVDDYIACVHKSEHDSMLILHSSTYQSPFISISVYNVHMAFLS